MIPAEFDYYRATSTDDAVARLAELGDDAKVLAGGHSLIPFMRLRFARPSALVDINGLTDLSYIRSDGTTLRIGAMTRHVALQDSTIVKEQLPLLAEAASRIGDPQVRNRGTIGGSVAHADPAGELPTVCLIMDADIVTTKRTVPARDFFQGRYTTPLAHDEVVCEIAFPVAKGRGAYVKFGHRLFDWAIVGAAVQRTEEGYRIGLVNASDVPVRAVAVEQALATGASPAEAAQLASDGLDPTPALRGSTQYKLELTRVLTRRAIEQVLAT